VTAALKKQKPGMLKMQTWLFDIFRVSKEFMNFEITDR